ncbi:hypothetical protein [Pseudoduganella aquatica]|uniref:Glycosyltransferase family 1 protein n=1 Tax=Pseudoduganella aquatica TaxID=2660641 RepID=A0A7X4KPB2_9BURK|nr:hypothetical protein [Pseudoduganella aquatica]MYN10032.1 hypothetical protein [Pseudoduganella aquatica]
MRTRPYVILTPSYCVSAGVRVMHHLCHELNGLGFDAKLMLTSNLSPPGEPLVNPALNTPVINGLFPEHWDRINEESIVISSDGVIGNPFNAKRLVRYVLGRENQPTAADEFPLYYSRTFPMDKSKAVHTLYYLPIDLSVFNPNYAPARDQDMLWLGKGAKFCLERPPGAVDITYTWPPTREELAANLRRTRYMYSYDAVSATNGEAVLCGAVVILKHLSYHDWEWTRADVEATELGAGGFAFDESEAEIERAFNSRGEQMERARHIMAAYRPSLLAFVEASQHRFRL